MTDSEQRLGPYRLIRIIGEGGMARIYLAQDETHNRLCAIKRLHSAHFSDRITVGRFLREARAVAGIVHPNLVAIYDVIEEPDEICLVMEYLDGYDLSEMLHEEGPLDPHKAAFLCAQACDGLDVVHARGIIHRDLKPENLFLAYEASGQERVKLLDFGVARLYEEVPHDLRTKTGQTVGTPMYMSPEQATASEELDARSDIYMMGVVLFELLTGTRPFIGAGYGEVMLKHVHDAPPRPSSRRTAIPGWLENVVMRCLEKDPAARYASAGQLAYALRGKVTPKEELRVERITADRRWSSRTWAFFFMAVLAVALALVILIARISTTSHAPPMSLPASALPPPPAAALPPSASAHLRVISSPPGVAIHVDGVMRCRAPCELELPAQAASPLEISATAPHFNEQIFLIDPANLPKELRFELRRQTHGISGGVKGDSQ